MRHTRRPPRAAIGPGASILFAALGVALAAAPALASDPPVAAGEAAYAEACASCHRTPTRVLRRYAEMAPQERAAALDRFLADHYAPDAAKRAAIIAWLTSDRRR